MRRTRLSVHLRGWEAFFVSGTPWKSRFCARQVSAKHGKSRWQLPSCSVSRKNADESHLGIKLRRAFLVGSHLCSMEIQAEPPGQNEALGRTCDGSDQCRILEKKRRKKKKK